MEKRRSGLINAIYEEVEKAGVTDYNSIFFLIKHLITTAYLKNVYDKDIYLKRYVDGRTKEEIQSEIRSFVYLGNKMLDLNFLFESCASVLTEDYLKAMNNNIIDNDDVIINHINSLNVNDRLKAYLINEYIAGRYNSLYGFVPDDLLISGRKIN